MRHADPLSDPGGEAGNLPVPATTHTGKGFLPVALLFLITSSVIFAALFEWPRYQIILSLGAQRLTTPDNGLLFWALAGKSLLFFLPVLALCSVLTAIKLRRAAILVLGCCWLVGFYQMASDLVCVGFTGYHSWEYRLPLREIVSHPWLHARRWISEAGVSDSVLILGAFIILGTAMFVFSGWVIGRIGRDRNHRGRQAIFPAALYIPLMLGPVFGLALFSDPNVMERVVYTAFPAKVSRDRVLAFTKSVAEGLAISPTQRTLMDAPRADPQSPRAPARSVRHDIAGSGDTFANVDPADLIAAKRIAREAVEPGPVDSAAFVRKAGLPNLIIIIFESFRHDAISPDYMRNLDTWARKGLRLERHYSGSNCSHLGLFSLFYGRSALGYYQNFDRNVPPQLLDSLRRSGYEITFLTSGETKGHRGFDNFFNDKYCDNVILENQIGGNDMSNWPASDRGKLARLESMINAPKSKPQCVFFYLMSSHWGYAFPPEYELYKEESPFRRFFDPRGEIRSLMNRYVNSLLFLEHEVMKVLQSIDTARNIVVITGDHGESMADDGVFRHGTKMSDIQMRAPCVIVGAGVEPRTITTATSHLDLTPTLLHVMAGRNITVKNCQGRDLIADQAPADEVILSPANGMEWEGLLVIRGNKRLVFQTQTVSGSSEVKFKGVVDETGLYTHRIEYSR
jgi:hypothetical protein